MCRFYRAGGVYPGDGSWLRTWPAIPQGPELVAVPVVLQSVSLQADIIALVSGPSAVHVGPGLVRRR